MVRRSSLDPNVVRDQLTNAPRNNELFNLTINVITPMFGGGYEAGEVDSERPINAKEIRGHLRFWWRACKGGGFRSAEEMFEKEAEIWGSTDKPSAVDVVVEVTNAGRSVACARFTRGQDGLYRATPTFEQNWPPYALFPFQGKLTQSKQQIEVNPSNALTGVEFRLILSRSASSTLSEEELREEVGDALWAWITFGGIGARTRRGCGALWCSNGYPFEQLDPNRLVEIAGSHIDGNGIAQIPKLSGASLVVGNNPANPLTAWCRAVEVIKDFRQDRNQGQQHNRPGRSRWPEPDSIRRISGRACGKHQPNPDAPNYFPRADLGLPIVFHFKDRGDPGDHILGIGDRAKGRMASPVIAKPLAISETQALPMILLLNAPHAWESMYNVILCGQVERPLIENDINDPAKNAKVAPLRGQSAREALLDFAARRLNGEVVEL